MKKQFLLIAAVTAAVIFAGCENTDTGADDIGDAITMAEEEIADLKTTATADEDISAARFGGHKMKGGMGIGGSHLFFGRHFPNCATVTVSGDGFPKEIVIEYGEGCTGRRGLEKRGTITIQMSDTILVAGATYTITTENLTVGERSMERTATVTNEGQNGDGNWVISSVSSSTTSFERDGENYVIVREKSVTNEWMSGFDTPEIEDDQLVRNGTGTITVNDELKFNRIVSDLHIDRSCMYPLSGTVEITKDGEALNIDYGDGECDNIAVVTKDGESEEIELNRGRFRNGFNRDRKHIRKGRGWW